MIASFSSCRREARAASFVTLVVLVGSAVSSAQTSASVSASASAAEEAFREAERLLADGEAAEAESKARDAIARSLRFVPEQEIEARPDKGLLFEDMILEARAQYRERRARYFYLLGSALTAQEKFRAARKVYRRAPSLDGLLDMAGHPDLSVDQRVELLIEAYTTPGADTRALEARLLETGAFRSRHAFDAGLDRRRFRSLAERFEDLELLPGAFPEVSIVTDAGTLNTAQLFRTGNLMIVYVPVEGCARCSEELDGLTVPVTNLTRAGGVIDVILLVREAELPGTRRIVRLLGVPVGVGRKDALPADLQNDFLEQGEMRVVGRGGLVQIRLPMTESLASAEVRPRIEAAIELLDDAATLRADRERKAQPLVTLERERGAGDKTVFLDWIETIDRLEAGPAPVDDLYAELARLARSLARSPGADRALGIEMLAALSRLEGAHTAKTTALSLIDERIGDLLLERVQSVDDTVRRTATGTRGAFHTAVSADGDRIYLQRGYQSLEGLRHFDIAIDLKGGSLSVPWTAPEDEPLGVTSVREGGAFHFYGHDGCRGVKLIAIESDRVAYESCAARIVDGELVEALPALVDAVTATSVPSYYRRDVTNASQSEPGALERGLQAFEDGDFASALAAFEEAASEIDEEAPYDASDLLYNRARALDLMGERSEALELYRSLGDVSYQALVDERANAIETGQEPQELSSSVYWGGHGARGTGFKKAGSQEGRKNSCLVVPLWKSSGCP